MPLICLSSAWIAGLYLGSKVGLPWELALPLLALLGAFSFLFRRHNASLLAGLSLVVLVLGMLRFQTSVPTLSPDDLPSYNDGGSVELRGVVDSFPEPGDRTTAFRLAVKELKQSGGWTKVEGTALVHAPKTAPWESRDFPYYRYGDLLQLKGRLETPPSGEDFDYQEYLAREGVKSLVRYPSRVELLGEGQGFKPLEAIYHVRGALSQALASALPEPQGSLAQGILLGLRGDIPQSVKDALAETGTTHILAISGQNLTIVLALIVAATVWLWGRGRPYYLAVSLAALWGYTALTGMSPSVLRAAIMGSLWLLAQYLGRPQSGAPALLFAAALMAGLQPSVLWDISFQLSFAAMAGIIFIAPTFRRTSPSPGQAGGRHSPTALLWDALWISGAAVLATAPIIALNFHRFSLTGLPATLLALPALPPIILTSAFTAGLGLLSAPLAQVAGWLVWLFTTYLLKVVELFSALPLASVETKGVTEPMVWAYYILMAGVLWLTGQRQRLLPFLREAAASVREKVARLRATWLLGLPAVAALIIWLAAFSLPDGRLHVYFLDVGQGSATLVRTPSGQNVIIDGGPGSRAIDLGLGRALPFWDRGLDLAVLTHPHDDHVTGLAEVLRRYRVGQALEGDQAADSPNYQEWLKLLREKGIARTVAHAGQEVRLGQGVKLEVLHPPGEPLLGTASDPDNNALVLRLFYGQVSFLLAADLQREGESYLINSGLELGDTVLQVGHHGSETSTTPEFLEAVSPQLAVISVGANNPFGHPSAAVRERLNGRLGPEKVLLTSERGTIEVITDGRRIWVKTEKPKSASPLNWSE